MKSVIQRVDSASVIINNSVYNTIGKGLLVLLGVKKGDTTDNASKLAKKIIDLRIFGDENGLMNLSVKNVKGEVLVISQFTLCTVDEKSGNRPSFTNAEEPELANKLYMECVNTMKEYYENAKIKTGVFAEEMKINLINNGPVTIILEK